MEEIKIQLDYMSGPIWGNYYDEKLNKVVTGVDVIDNNDELQKLNKQIQDMYSSYYEFDSHDQACWFNKEQELADKDEMLKLITELINKIKTLNDGSFKIVDLETERIRNLK